VAIPIYRGPFGPAQAERLLWRAGFGPRPGEAAALAPHGLDAAVRSLTRPAVSSLDGPEPHDGDGNPLRPADEWGHDHLWWLDRMVRSRRPLVERMTLLWHDWFATSRDGVQANLLLRQNELFRRHALGNFARLLEEVTKDPAMLVWLSGDENTRWSPNENYARELMELFTLGADRGYSERDVREQARALTGWTDDWREGVGHHNFHYDRDRHDSGLKRIFSRRGRFTWRDSCRLVLRHRSHAPFFVRKLWGYFVPVPPDAATERALRRLYVRGNFAVRPVVEAILRHPALYAGPRMVKPPIVYTAGLLRARGRGIDTDSWAWIGSLAGQRLFLPPNVAGWDDARWLDTATFRGRWVTANYAIGGAELKTDSAVEPFDPAQLVERAIAFWGSPTVSTQTRGALLAFAQAALGDADRTWKRQQYPVLTQNALRQLLAVSPDLMTS
jgi:uncharacterized protein (DUF1800 family)